MTSRMNTEYIFNTTYRFAKWKKNKIKTNKQTNFVSTLEGLMKEKDTVQNNWEKSYLENFLNFTLKTHTHVRAHTNTHAHIPDPGNKTIATKGNREGKGWKEAKGSSQTFPPKTYEKRGTHLHTDFTEKKLCPKNIHQVKLLCSSQSSWTAFSHVNMFSKYDIHSLAENTTYTYSACRV